jgi:hypothetical protein
MFPGLGVSCKQWNANAYELLGLKENPVYVVCQWWESQVAGQK